MKRKSNNKSGFTLVEVLIAATILAFATFGVLGILRLSDVMSYRAMADGKVAQIFRARVGTLQSLTYSQFKTLANSVAVDVGGSYKFQNGSVPTTAPNPYTFPTEFVGAGDPFSILGSQAQAHYLLNGKPLPGSTLETKIFPYMEQVSLTFLNGYEVNVTYKLSWQDVFADGQPVKVLTFSFNKYDYSTL